MSEALIKHKAIEFSKNESFTAYLGWFELFMIGENLFLRRVTTSGRDLPSDYQEIVDSSLNDCNDQFCANYHVDRNTIINMKQEYILIQSSTIHTLPLDPNVFQQLQAVMKEQYCRSP